MEPALLLGIGLIAGGILLIALEAFIPSGGVIGLISFAMAIGGIVVLFRHDPMWGLAGLLATLVLGPTAFFYAINTLPNTPMGRRLIGQPDEEQIAAERAREQALRNERAALVGMEGVAMTPLRPVGTVRIDGKRYEAVAEHALIDPGQRVRVTRADAMSIKVRLIA